MVFYTVAVQSFAFVNGLMTLNAGRVTGDRCDIIHGVHTRGDDAQPQIELTRKHLEATDKSHALTSTREIKVVKNE